MELYRFEPNAESLALLVCLYEKELPFTDCYVDVFALENFSDDYRELSRTAAVPLLKVGGETMTDTAVALQYLEEAHPEVSLAPNDPAGWYDMQAWMSKLAGPKALSANVNLLGWNEVMLESMPAADLERYRDGLAAQPRVRESGWGAVWSDAEAGEDQLENARERVIEILQKVEATIALQSWLAGDSYSLADILAFSYLHCLPGLLPGSVSADRFPAVTAWLEGIGSRPAVAEALGKRRREYAETVFLAPGG